MEKGRDGETEMGRNGETASGRASRYEIVKGLHKPNDPKPGTLSPAFSSLLFNHKFSCNYSLLKSQPEYIYPVFE